MSEFIFSNFKVPVISSKNPLKFSKVMAPSITDQNITKKTEKERFYFCIIFEQNLEVTP